jgi:flagellin-like hook-associated protein FlgL
MVTAWMGWATSLAAAAPASVPLLPDLNAKLHPADSTPWTILFVLTLITLADYSSGEVNTALAANDTTALSTALNYVSQQRVTIDSSITQLSAAAGAVTSEKTQLTAAQTDLMQADLPTISTQLSLAETQQTALEDVIAQLDSTANSLFSKLQG